jgi:hypothetical protein
LYPLSVVVDVDLSAQTELSTETQEQSGLLAQNIVEMYIHFTPK